MNNVISLTFVRGHRSILQLSAPDLPSFTLITGLNGVGKSQLLEAIAVGDIETNLTHRKGPNRETLVRYYTSAHLNQPAPEIVSSDALNSERAYIAARLREARQRTESAAAELVSNHPALTRFASDPLSLVDISEDLHLAIAAKTPRFMQQFSEVKGALLGGLNGDQRVAVENCARKLGKPIHALTERDLQIGRVPDWGEAELFKQNLSRAFLAYRDELQYNLMAKAAADLGDTGVEFLTPQQFEATFGPPPWSMLNDTLTASGLEFRVDKPEIFARSGYRATLLKGDTEIPFEGLSSGERVIIAMALVSYYTQDNRQRYRVPKLILLDEIDASLHPSMILSLLRTVEEIFVKKLGAAVVMTTHSPTTIALASDDAVHIMHAKPARLEKACRSEALNILAVGVPTLSLSFDGRRQVFCESLSDAQTYSALYEYYVRGLKVDRSLEFIATGVTTEDGKEAGTGKDAVISVVEALTSKGAISCFGLIDWDLSGKKSIDQIEVLAKGKRYALENVIFDPLYLAILIVRDHPQYVAQLGLTKQQSVDEFLKLPISEIQQITDQIVFAVLSAIDPTAAQGEQLAAEDARQIETETAEYGTGFTLRIDRRYLFLNGHELERKLLVAYPSLKKSVEGGPGGTAGRLMRGIVHKVIREHPELFPATVRTAFESLINRPAHAAMANSN